MEMIEDVTISKDSTRSIIAREVLAHAASVLLYPFGLGSKKKRGARKRDERTVVLIHGYLGNRSSFFPLQTYLRLVGVGKVISFHYRWGTGIDRAARELRDFLKIRVRGGRIDLVCHSLGGVIARVYLQQLGGARRTDRCITLGTPHQGTYNAYWVANQVGDELRPDSPLMKRLRASSAAGKRVKYSSIVGGSDNIVIPRVFAASGEDVLLVPNLGHLGLLFSPTVFRAVAQRLLKP